MGLGIKINPNAFKQGIKQARENTSVELEPGTYIASIQKLRGSNTDSSKLMLDMKVLDDNEEGKFLGSITLFYNLADDKIGFFIRDMEKLGFQFSEDDAEDPARAIEQIATSLEEARPVVRIKARRNGDFVNYRIERTIEDLVVAEAPKAPESLPVKTNSEPVRTQAAPAPGAKPAPATKPAPAPAKPAAPAPAAKPAPAAPKPDVAKYGELAALDRTTLKGLLAIENIVFPVTRAMSDDQIRDAILAHRASIAEEPAAEEIQSLDEVGNVQEDDPPAEAEPEVVEEVVEEEEVEIQVGMNLKANIRGNVVDARVESIDGQNNSAIVRNLVDQKKYNVTMDKLSL